ncbi:MAG: response regulator transcription factor [Chloroflexi bacterium]|nr:response regulator transcription factor [Chloroflexota bacterium]
MASDRAGLSTARAIRVLILDHHRWLREQLAQRLTREPDIEVVGKTDAASYQQGQVARLRPDIVLVEAKGNLPQGPATYRQIVHAAPDSAVIILTSYLDEEERRQALAAGVRAYLLKELDVRDLLATIRAIGKADTTEEQKAH